MTASLVETGMWFVWFGLVMTVVLLALRATTSRVLSPDGRQLVLGILAILATIILIAVVAWLDMRAKGSL